MTILFIYGIIINKNKDQSIDFLTLNSKRAPLEIASLFQLLPVDFLHFNIQQYAY